MYDKIIADMYEEVVNAGYHDQKTLVNELLEIIPKNSSVLEIGCGTGMTMLPLLKKGIACEGVDISKAMLDKLKSKNKKAKVYLADIKDFKPRKKYDFVLSCNGPFSIKEGELESYILERELIPKLIKKYLKISKKGILINKDIPKDSLALELKNDGQFIHRETKQGDYLIMMNMIFDRDKLIGKKDFIKRRFPIKEILKNSKIQEFKNFILIKP